MAASTTNPLSFSTPITLPNNSGNTLSVWFQYTANVEGAGPVTCASAPFAFAN
jgi:hypothetical protein